MPIRLFLGIREKATAKASGLKQPVSQSWYEETDAFVGSGPDPRLIIRQLSLRADRDDRSNTSSKWMPYGVACPTHFPRVLVTSTNIFPTFL